MFPCNQAVHQLPHTCTHVWTLSLWDSSTDVQVTDLNTLGFNLNLFKITHKSCKNKKPLKQKPFVLTSWAHLVSMKKLKPAPHTHFFFFCHFIRVAPVRSVSMLSAWGKWSLHIGGAKDGTLAQCYKADLCYYFYLSSFNTLALYTAGGKWQNIVTVTEKCFIVFSAENVNEGYLISVLSYSTGAKQKPVLLFLLFGIDIKKMKIT